MSRIEARKELTVARQQGDVWVDLILPAAEGASGAEGTQGEAP
jgi:hypothetical protein